MEKLCQEYCFIPPWKLKESKNRPLSDLYTLPEESDYFLEKVRLHHYVHED